MPIADKWLSSISQAIVLIATKRSTRIGVAESPWSRMVWGFSTARAKAVPAFHWGGYHARGQAYVSDICQRGNKYSFFSFIFDFQNITRYHSIQWYNTETSQHIYSTDILFILDQCNLIPLIQISSLHRHFSQMFYCPRLSFSNPNSANSIPEYVSSIS